MLKGKLVLVGDDGKEKPLKPSNEALNIVCTDVEREEIIMSEDVGGTSNVANKIIMQVDDSGEKANDNSLSSFTDVLNVNRNKKQDNFRVLTTPASSKCKVVIPRSSVDEVSGRLTNSLYGYFIDKRVTFLVGQNYVFNGWGKYGMWKTRRGVE